MIWDDSYIRLRDTLADIYWKGDDAARLVNDAKLDKRHMDFGGSAQQFWTSIIEQAAHNNQLTQLIEAACADYPNNTALRTLQETFSKRPDKTPDVLESPSRSRQYNLGIVHQLLTQVFTPDALDRFLRNSPTAEFQAIRHEFGFGMGLNQMVDAVIDNCQRFVLMEQLLSEVKTYNPAQYEQYASRLYRD